MVKIELGRGGNEFLSTAMGSTLSRKQVVSALIELLNCKSIHSMHCNERIFQDFLNISFTYNAVLSKLKPGEKLVQLVWESDWAPIGWLVGVVDCSDWPLGRPDRC